MGPVYVVVTETVITVLKLWHFVPLEATRPALIRRDLPHKHRVFAQHEFGLELAVWSAVCPVVHACCTIHQWLQWPLVSAGERSKIESVHQQNIRNGMIHNWRGHAEPINSGWVPMEHDLGTGCCKTLLGTVGIRLRLKRGTQPSTQISLCFK